MKIAVVTDSTAYLPQKDIEKYNIRIVPIPVIMDGKTYQEGIDITTDQFFEKLRTSDSFPSTSQPSVGELVELYENLGDQGYDTVISIHLAATISGLFNTLKTVVAPQVKKVKVIPIDSKITVMLMGNLVLEAARMAQRGENVANIIKRIEHLQQTMNEYFVVDDLQNLVRGGRLSNASAFLGSVLKIKPILTFDDQDKIVAFEKVRSAKRALKRVEDLFEEQVKDAPYPVRMIVIHANDKQAALNWQKKLAKQYPQYPIDLSYFGPVIGAHLGEKALALAWMEDIEQ
ncbi:DegV family protein [Ligilactobacillus salitolerans]|uniref:DegV family protein n=1 Tax=Ligilactobacillus salitolerans TaxID=1808352 RepID=A0A401ITP3_9LACO|nr:DegV family protein [Ligilactobacillus salitolerans]GBG94889.1 DegV family protein [Ligilactobacillus salitolerans]